MNQMNNNMTNQPDRKGLAIAALVLGIVSIVFMCIIYLAIPTGAAAIICGALSMKSSGRGMAIGGIVCGAIGLLFSILFIIFGAMILAAVGYADSYGYYSMIQLF